MKIYIPKRMRFNLDDEEAQKSFVRKDFRFKASLIKNIGLYLGKDIKKYLNPEYKSFQNSNTNVTEIRCDDKLIALIYETRTEFNHQEVVWAVFTDVLPKIKKSFNQIKSRDI